jgi:predicted nucleotidyltransferase
MTDGVSSVRKLMETARREFSMRNFKAVSTENPELQERFDRVLQAVMDALASSRITYLFIGGVASAGLGRPRSTTDIDIFVRPEDRERTLRALDSAGFTTQKTDPVWLYKAFKENILVDIIFKSKGEIYLDSHMLHRRTMAEYHGMKLWLVSPEDLIVIKALAHSEATPGHWHDALALLSYAEIDWDYLLQRARKAPRRVLSLLLYAQSNDLWVPDAVVAHLYEDIFGSGHGVTLKGKESSSGARLGRRFSHGEDKRRSESHLRYDIERLREEFAADERLGELDVEVLGESGEQGARIVIRGETMSNEYRDLLSQLAQKKFPECKIDNQVRIIEPGSPNGTEAA